MELLNRVRAYETYCRLEKNLSENSLRAYFSDLKCFCSYIKANSYDKSLEGSDLENLVTGYLQYLQNVKGLKRSSIKRKVACLKSMFKWMARRQWIDKSPFETLDIKIKLPNPYYS